MKKQPLTGAAAQSVPGGTLADSIQKRTKRTFCPVPGRAGTGLRWPNASSPRLPVAATRQVVPFDDTSMRKSRTAALGSPRHVSGELGATAKLVRSAAAGSFTVIDFGESAV